LIGHSPPSMPAMLGEDPFPGPFAMGPWLNGVDISPWPCDAAVNVATAATTAAGLDPMGVWSMGAASPWVQPYHEEIERLQQQVDDLKLWKLHAEESMRAYHQASMVSGFSWPPPRLPFDEEAIETLSVQSTLSTAASEFVPPWGTPTQKGSVSPSSFSSLPLPAFVPQGPAPAPPRPAVPNAHEGSESLLQLPPGLANGLGMLPPGLTLAMAASLNIGDKKSVSKAASVSLATGTTALHGCSTELSAKTATLKPSSPAQCSAATSEAPPGMWIGPVQVAGTSSVRAEWHIEDLRSRLQACMGRPLVSPPFAVCGLPNLRLMVFPDAREAVKSVRSRERKGLYAAMVKKGPLHGALKLKADCLPLPTVLTFMLTVGGARKGPFTYDFSAQAIHGCDDFSVDWLRQVDDGTDNLRVGVEILEIKESRGLNSAVREGLSPQELYSMALRQLELS